MMKKITAIFLSILLMLCLPGCSASQDSFVAPVTFYYPELAQEDGSIANVIGAETREGQAYVGDLKALLSQYLLGPKDPAFYSPFPDHVDMIDASVTDGKVTIIFSESFAELSSLDRSIACASIGMTCMEFTGAQQVEIFAENTLFDGEESILITRDSLLMEDNTPITEP